MLELRRLVAGYHAERPVIRGVDLEVGRGEFLGLLGPNGCGKSTLIRAIAGAAPVCRGEIRLLERDARTLSRREMARCIGVVPQDTSCAFAFSVREIVAMGRHPYTGRFRGSTAEDEGIVDEALELSGTAHLAGRSILELSGGERQRAVIARALAQTPQLLLLDEPTSHLDINHQVEVFDLLYHLNKERGLTLLCVTHDLNFAARYCNRLVLMDRGAIHACGSPEEVVRGEIISALYGIELEVESRGGCPHVVPRSRALGRRGGEGEAA